MIAVLVVAGAIASAVGAMAGTQGARRQANPPTKLPFLVDRSGQIIPESVPDTIGLAGPDGKVAARLTREDFLRLLGPPPGPPGSLANDTGSTGPTPDRSILIQQSAEGRVATTVKGALNPVVSRSESSK